MQRLKDVKSVGIDVGLDFHGRVHKTLAKQLAAALEPHKPLFIEEPLLPGQVPEMEKLYRKTNIPIAVSTTLSLESGVGALTLRLLARRTTLHTSRRPTIL